MCTVSFLMNKTRFLPLKTAHAALTRAAHEPYLSESQISFFHQFGYIVLPKFWTPQVCRQLQASISNVIKSFDFNETRTVFTTNDQERTSDQYFLESGDKIRYFWEDGAFDAKDRSNLRFSPELCINKIGHAIHDIDPTFKKFSYDTRIGQIARDIGLKAPVPIQSMYIFKQPWVGGRVDPHQDGTFLHTDPRPSVLGLWWALEDCTLDNGCLWAVPGSHRHGIYKKFVRAEKEGGQESTAFEHVPNGGEVEQGYGSGYNGSHGNSQGNSLNRAGGDGEGWSSLPYAPPGDLPACPPALFLPTLGSAGEGEGKDGDGGDISAVSFAAPSPTIEELLPYSVPLTVEKGTLVLLHHSLWHFSKENDGRTCETTNTNRSSSRKTATSSSSSNKSEEADKASSNGKAAVGAGEGEKEGEGGDGSPQPQPQPQPQPEQQQQPKSRHAYTLHLIDSSDDLAYPPTNWLQRPATTGVPYNALPVSLPPP